MTVQPELVELKVWHHNVRGSSVVQRKVLELAHEKDVHIVAIEEASEKTGGGNGEYAVTCYGYTLAFEFEATHRVAFYVRHQLAEWSPTFVSDHISTITVRTGAGSVHFHNVYIPPKETDKWPVERITDLLQTEGEHVLMGDFNLHHYWWSGPAIPSTKIKRLAHDLEGELKLANYLLANKSGGFTYEKTVNGKNTKSVLDLTFVSPGKSFYC